MFLLQLQYRLMLSASFYIDFKMLTIISYLNNNHKKYVTLQVNDRPYNTQSNFS